MRDRSVGFALALAGLLAFSFGACGDEETVPVSEDPPPELSTPLSAADVSILYPLPPPALRTSMLGPTSSGKRGALLPIDDFAVLPRLQPFTDNPETYATLRVVGVRLDPCFPTLDRGTRPTGGCMPQVRMVWMPLSIVDREGTTVVTAFDSAVHTFYELSDEEFELLLRYVVAARKESLGEAHDDRVGPHPALLAEGIEGKFGKALERRLLDVAGGENLVRVTFMASESFGDTWRFGGFDRKEGVLEPFPIASLTATDQIFINLDFDGINFLNGQALPDVTSMDNIGLLFDSEAAMSAGTAPQDAAYRAALRVENPAMHRPDTIDCVSCHVAPAARRWAEGTLGLSSQGLSENFVDAAGAEIAGATTERTDELRAFGYFDERVSISQRVANETYAVVRFIEAEHNIARD